MKRNVVFLVAFLLIIVSSCAQAYEVGVDYPDYHIYEGNNFYIDSSTRPILLIHGWSNEAKNETSSWGNLEYVLEREGYDILRLEYWPANLSNEKNAGMIGDAIEYILDNYDLSNGEDKIDVVAHSMGNLGILGYINGMGIDETGDTVEYKGNIGKYASIAGPIQGSYFANIVDNTGNRDILKEHPPCQQFVEGKDLIFLKDGNNLEGNTEATRDMQIGSDFTWDLNKNINLVDVDFLSISGKHAGSGAFNEYLAYCVSNDLEINDGIVSLINSNLLKKNYPLSVFDEFHSGVQIITNPINKDNDVGKMISLFLKDNLNYSTAWDGVLSKSDGESYYNPLSGEGELPDELQNKGSIILQLLKSNEDSPQEITNVSLKKMGGKYLGLEKNKNTNRWFYVYMESNAPNKKLDFTTMLPKGEYYLSINNHDNLIYDIQINKEVQENIIEVKNAQVSLLELNFDKDADLFNLEEVGGTDCNDSRSLTYPGAFEECNLIDDNCHLEVEDDGINETWFNESTGCGIGECKSKGNLLCITGNQNDTCEPGEPQSIPSSACSGGSRGGGSGGLIGGLFSLFDSEEEIICEKILEEKDYNCDGLVGLISEINKNLSLSYEREDTTLMFKENGSMIIEFEFDIFKESLDIENLSIQKNGENDTFSYLVVNGLDLESHDQTKTLYLDRIANGTGICVKDAEVESIENISNRCDGEGEYWLTCPGSNGDYSCNLIEDEARYAIGGLRHSGVKEQETYCGDEVVNGDENCLSCAADVGICPPEDKEINSNSGGGGGGSSSKKIIPIKNQSDIVINQTEEVTLLLDEIVENKGNESEREKGGFVGITGAVIGATMNNLTVSLVFILVIVVSIVGLRTRGRKRREDVPN